MIAPSPTSTAKTANPANEVEGASSADSSWAPDRQTLLLGLVLAVAVFVCYSRVIHNQFLIYDDNEYITENAHIKGGMSWGTVKWAFTTFDASNYHPLTWISHAVDCTFFGLSPAGPHLINVLLHAINATLLFFLLQYATGYRWRSLMVAALFALHPINVESVAWAAERKNVLSMMFFLLALYAYTWYTRQPSRQRYAAVAGLFVLALLAKPQVITFPFLLLLWDYWPLGRSSVLSSRFSVLSSRTPAAEAPRSFSFLLREKVPLFLLSAVSAVLTLAAQKAGGAVRDLTRYSLPLRLETAVVSYVRYLQKALWPSSLIAIYPHPNHLYPVWQVGGAAILLIVLTTVVLLVPGRRYLAMGWFWFLGSMVPMIGLVQVGEQEFADRYAYISFLGLFLMVVWLIADWAGNLGKARGSTSRWLAAPAVVCLLALGVLTYRQVGYWHDTESFWRRTLALSPDNYVAHKGLGRILYDEGKTDEALTHVRAVLVTRPDDTAANLILADVERKQGNLEGSLERYQMVATHATGVRMRAQAFAQVAGTYRLMKQPEKAKQNYEASLRLAPDQPTVLVQLGLMAELDDNNIPAAVQYYARAMRMQPTDVGLLLLANALLEEGGHDKQANDLLERAASISKNIDAAERQAKALLGEK